MRAIVVLSSLSLLALTLLAADASAHGGVWRGPPLTPPSLTPPPVRGVPTRGSPLPPSFTPRPGPLTAQPKPGPGAPATPSLPRATGGITGPVAPGTPRTSYPLPASGPSLDHWTFWWELNRERILDLRRLQKERLDRRTRTPDVRFVGEPGDKNTPPPIDDKERSAILEALLAAAQDKNADVATGAIIALGKAGDERAIPVLMEIADRGSDATARESAVLALGMIGKLPGTVRPFLSRIADDTKRRLRTRAFAVLGIGFLSDVSSIPDLMGRLRARSASRDVPASALIALGLVGDELVVPDLANALSGDRRDRHPDEYLRAYSAAALGMIRSRTALPALVKALRDPSKEVRRQTVLSIGALGNAEDKEIAQLLARILVKDRDSQVRAFSAVALGQMGIPQAADTLLYAYRKGDRVVVPYAAIGLGLLCRNAGNPALSERAVPYLRAQFLERGGNDLKAALAISLGIAGDRKAAPLLLRELSGGGDPALKGHYAVALGLIGAEEAIPALRKALVAKGNPDLQREVALALALIGDQGAVRILTDLVKNAKTEFVRGSAAVALGRLASPATADALRKILEDEKNPTTTRAFVAVALGQVMDPHAQPLLSRIGENFNHRMAVEAIAEILTFL